MRLILFSVSLILCTTTSAMDYGLYLPGPQDNVEELRQLIRHIFNLWTQDKLKVVAIQHDYPYRHTSINYQIKCLFCTYHEAGTDVPKTFLQQSITSLINHIRKNHEKNYAFEEMNIRQYYNKLLSDQLE